MRPNRNDPSRDWAHLEDMLVAARTVRQFVLGRTLEDYSRDLLLRSAVERQIEIIGEAARSVSDLTQAAHPEIPWSPIIAQRHRLAHEYGAIDDALIWRVATFYVPQLIALLEPLIPPEPPASG